MWDYLFIYVFKIKRKLKCISFLSVMLFSMIKNETLILSIPCMCAQLYPTLCNPVDCSLPGFSVHRILQARILEWLLFPSPGDLPNPGLEPTSPALAGRFFTTEPPRKPSLNVQTLLIGPTAAQISWIPVTNNNNDIFKIITTNLGTMYPTRW